VAETFKFELVSPERLLLSADAEQALVPGAEGDFTVLPRHAPVLSTLRAGLLDVKLGDGKERRIFVRGGFAEVEPDSLTVLAAHAIDLDYLDAAALAQEVRNAEEDVADARGEAARDRAQERLDRLRLVKSTLNLS
jgi:F-type H+-transporting ATPase subunit epsilon